MTKPTEKPTAELEVPVPARRPFEEWVAEKKPAAWLAAAAKAGQGWAIGREVTEAEFDQALREAGAVVMRI